MGSGNLGDWCVGMIWWETGVGGYCLPLPPPLEKRGMLEGSWDRIVPVSSIHTQALIALHHPFVLGYVRK